LFQIEQFQCACHFPKIHFLASFCKMSDSIRYHAARICLKCLCRNLSHGD